MGRENPRDENLWRPYGAICSAHGARGAFAAKMPEGSPRHDSRVKEGDVVRKVWRGVLVLVLVGMFSGGNAWGENDLERFNAVLEKTIVTCGNSVEEVIRRMGPPQSQDVRPEVSPHDPSYRFEWVHLAYPHRQITLFRAPDKEFLVQIDTQRPEDVFGDEIRVGCPRKDVVRELGEPLETREKTMIYQDEAGYSELGFVLDAQNRVERMTLVIMLD